MIIMNLGIVSLPSVSSLTRTGWTCLWEVQRRCRFTVAKGDATRRPALTAQDVRAEPVEHPAGGAEGLSGFDLLPESAGIEFLNGDPSNDTINGLVKVTLTPSA
jgi:hypothetical protein